MHCHCDSLPDINIASRSINPEARRLTVQAWSTMYRVNQENTGTIARRLVEQALQIDPNYLPALNALTFATFRQRLDGSISREEEEQEYM